MYIGLVNLGAILYGSMIAKDSSSVPLNSTAVPTYRVYGENGLMTNGTGSASFRDTGSITGATNATPIEITSAAHGLTTGQKVTITGVGGNTAANGTFTIMVTGTNTFTLDGSVGNGAYTSGGIWNVSGVYKFSFTVSAGDGYQSGKNFFILFTYAISGTTYAVAATFTVS